MATKVVVKWGKQVLDDVEIDTNESVQVFKTQLWTLTGVPPERQKILGFKGGQLKDDADWGKAGLKQGMKLMLMGTADQIPIAAPEVQTKFVEDLVTDPDQVDAMTVTSAADSARGLRNLGYTCYANATVQCLTAVPELRERLEVEFPKEGGIMPPLSSVGTIRDLLTTLADDKPVGGDGVIVPMSVIATLRRENPQFQEKGQHDAQECLVTILRILASGFDTAKRQAASSGSAPSAEANAIDELFGIQMESTDKCIDSDESVTKREMVRALMCYITKDVNSLNQGLVMEESIEKRSDALDRTAEWKRTAKIAKLPPYLWVNFVRFYSSASDPSKTRAKILRNVTFPLMFDAFNLCTDEVKSECEPGRAEIRRQEDDKVNKTKADMDVDTKTKTPKDPVRVTESKSGMYELCAVLTHKGRALDSGHYVAWVKHTDEVWFKFDDETVTTCTPDDIQKLSGGGDWHMAYMILYRARNPQECP